MGPRASLPFALEAPLLPALISLEVVTQQPFDTAVFDLDETEVPQPFRDIRDLSSSRHSQSFECFVEQIGPAKVMRFSHDHGHGGGGEAAADRGVLEVTVLEARGLRVMEWSEPPKLFCQLSIAVGGNIDTKHTFHTQVAPSSLNPQWKETFRIDLNDLPPERFTLRAQLLDPDFILNFQKQGEARVPLSNLPDDQYHRDIDSFFTLSTDSNTYLPPSLIFSTLSSVSVCLSYRHP